MATKIFSADITLGDPGHTITLKDQVVKKLPLNILQSNAHFMAWIKSRVTKTEIKRLTNKKTGLIKVSVEYKKEIGIVNEEPIIGEI